MSEPDRPKLPEPNADKAVHTVGERLRAAREARDQSLKDVAARTHQSVDTLKALEEMTTGGLSRTVVRMQAARYARALDLPADEIANGYADARTMMDVERMETVRKIKTERFSGRTLAFGALGVLVAGAALALGVSLVSGVSTKRGEVPISSRVLEPVSTYTQAATTSSGADLRDEVSLRANESAWIEVRGSDGTIFRSRQMRAGEVYYPRTGAGWTVTVRNAAAFDLMIDGRPVMALGDEATPAYSISIDRSAETARVLLQQQIADTSDKKAARP